MGRAGQVLGVLVVVNAVMLWFFAGAGASLGWHDRMLDDDTLRACGQEALAAGPQGVRGLADHRDPRFAAAATVRFAATLTDHRSARERTVTVECRLGTREDATQDDPLVVREASVVG